MDDCVEPTYVIDRYVAHVPVYVRHISQFADKRAVAEEIRIQASNLVACLEQHRRESAAYVTCMSSN